MNKIISRAEAKALGLKKYFTGKPCKRGHAEERWTRDGGCNRCKLDDALAWKKRNAEHCVAYKKEYDSQPEVKEIHNQRLREKRAANPEEIRSKDRARRDANIERHREWTRAWKAKNRERLAKESREYYWANRDAVLERERLKNLTRPETNRSRVKAWRKANPEGKRAQYHLRRSRILGSTEHHTAQDIRDLMIRQRHKCANCRDPIKKGYHVDHIVPLARGGSNGKLNIQLLCPTCNVKKRAKDPIDWAQENGRLL